MTYNVFGGTLNLAPSIYLLLGGLFSEVISVSVCITVCFRRFYRCCLMIGVWFYGMLSKYWILVCSVLFLVLAIQHPNVYRIIYMVLFLYFVISFQVCLFSLHCKLSIILGTLLIYVL